MSKFLHDAMAAKAIEIPRVFSENSQAKNASNQYFLFFSPCFLIKQNLFIDYPLSSANDFRLEKCKIFVV